MSSELGPFYSIVTNSGNGYFLIDNVRNILGPQFRREFELARKLDPSIIEIVYSGGVSVCRLSESIRNRYRSNNFVFPTNFSGLNVYQWLLAVEFSLGRPFFTTFFRGNFLLTSSGSIVIDNPLSDKILDKRYSVLCTLERSEFLKALGLETIITESSKKDRVAKTMRAILFYDFGFEMPAIHDEDTMVNSNSSEIEMNWDLVKVEDFSDLFDP